MTVPDWKAIAEELSHRWSIPRDTVEIVTARHTREVPEGLATRLREVLCGNCLDYAQDATPEACAQLDADAEAMRRRLAVGAWGGFRRLDVLPDESRRIVMDMQDGQGPDYYEGDGDQAAYDAAFGALRKAGKLP